MTDPPPSWRLRFRRWRRYWLRDPALAALNYSLLYLVRCLPTERGSRVGAVIGTINGRWRYPAIRERIKTGYVHLTDETKSPAELDALVDTLFANTGRTMLEFALLYRLWDEGRVEVDAAPLLAARAQNRPVVCVGRQLGNRENLGVALAGMGIEFTSFYQPPVSRFDHRIAVKARQSYGARLFPPDLAGTRAALRLLTEERGVLGIYGDEERRGYVFAPLFGRQPAPHANLVIAVRLAMASNAALIPCYVERLAGARFRDRFPGAGRARGRGPRGRAPGEHSAARPRDLRADPRPSRPVVSAPRILPAGTVLAPPLDGHPDPAFRVQIGPRDRFDRASGRHAKPEPLRDDGDRGRHGLDLYDRERRADADTRPDRERQVGVARARRDLLRREAVGVEPVGVVHSMRWRWMTHGEVPTTELRGIRWPQTSSSSAAAVRSIVGAGG